MIFHGTCHIHIVNGYRGHKVVPLKECHSDETLGGALCDECNFTCTMSLILCDNCDAPWHYQCAPVTLESAERIDKWYCERCRAEDRQLRITYKDGVGEGEIEGANAMATPPPGPSSGM